MAYMLSLAYSLQEYVADAVAFASSALMIGGYYLFLHRQMMLDPTYSIQAVNAVARRLWTESVMTSPGKDVMAVQTLRNFIMVSTMMASTASVLIIGTLTLSGQAESIIKSWHALAFLGSHSEGLWIFKVLLLLADFIVAFFAYALSMRLTTHVLFMINVPQSGFAEHQALGPGCVGNRLVRAGNFVSLGMRAFLFAIPLVFWLFGPLFLFLATIGLVITLYRLDRHEAADNRAASAMHDLAAALSPRSRPSAP
jgi:uncharacterized membrane protein